MSGVILLSGGMDSGVLAADITFIRGDQQLYALSFNYGSKHNSEELLCAYDIAKEYCDDHVIIDLPLDQYFKSSLLLGGEDIPEGHYQDESMKSTVVPFRNGIMLSIAAGYAESKRANFVFLASHAGDHAIYPDCTPGFNEAMALAITRGTYHHVEFRSPYAMKEKREIGLIGQKSGFDFSKTYSCYKGEPIHCGKCGTCVERKEALEGFDPTIYQTEGGQA